MAGAKSGKAPSGTFAPGGSEVFEGSGRDYFTDPHFHRDSSLEQSKQQWKDQDRLEKIKETPAFNPKFQKEPMLEMEKDSSGNPAIKKFQKGGSVDDGGIINKPGQVVRTRRQEQERRETEDKRDRNIMSYELDYYKGKAGLPTSQRAPYVTPIPQFNKGGMVQKHGSSTCVHSRTKG